MFMKINFTVWLIVLLQKYSVSAKDCDVNDTDKDERIYALEKQSALDMDLRWASGSTNISFSFNIFCNHTKTKHCRHSLYIGGISNQLNPICKLGKRQPVNKTFDNTSVSIYFEKLYEQGNKTGIHFKIVLVNPVVIGHFPVQIKFTHKDTCTYRLTSFNISYCSTDISSDLRVNTKNNPGYGATGKFECIDDRAQPFLNSSPVTKNTTCNEKADWSDVDDVECWSEPKVELKHYDGDGARFENGDRANFSCHILSGNPTPEVEFILGTDVHQTSFKVNHTHHGKIAFCKYSNKYTMHYKHNGSGIKQSTTNMTLNVSFLPVETSAVLLSGSCCNKSLTYCETKVVLKFESNPGLRKGDLNFTFGGQYHNYSITGDCENTKCTYHISTSEVEHNVTNLKFRAYKTRSNNWEKTFELDLTNNFCDSDKAGAIVHLTHNKTQTKAVTYKSGDQAKFNCEISPNTDPLTKAKFFLAGDEYPPNFSVNHTHNGLTAYCNYTNNFTENSLYNKQSNKITIEVFFQPVEISANLSSSSCCSNSPDVCNATLDLGFKSNPVLNKHNFTLSFGDNTYTYNTGECGEFSYCNYIVSVSMMDRELRKMKLHTNYTDFKYHGWSKTYDIDINPQICDENSMIHTTTMDEYIIVVIVIAGLIFVALLIIVPCYKIKKAKLNKRAELGNSERFETQNPVYGTTVDQNPAGVSKEEVANPLYGPLPATHHSNSDVLELSTIEQENTYAEIDVPRESKKSIEINVGADSEEGAYASVDITKKSTKNLRSNDVPNADKGAVKESNYDESQKSDERSPEKVMETAAQEKQADSKREESDDQKSDGSTSTRASISSSDVM